MDQNAGQDAKGVSQKEIKGLQNIAGMSMLHQIRNDEIRQSFDVRQLRQMKKSFSEDFNSFVIWEESRLNEPPPLKMHSMKDAIEKETKEFAVWTIKRMI